jgi:hypothetical protein
MRRTLVVLALVLTVGSTLGSALAAGSPRLQEVSTDPLVVRGTGFQRAERVKVRLTIGDESYRRLVRAGRAGTFRATFTSATVGRCSTFMILARGNEGSRATLRHPVFVDCAQP